MPDRTKIVYTAGRIDEALLLREMLAERGIESVIENELLQNAVGGLPAGESTAPRVRVAGDDAAKARQVVQQFERQERDGKASPPPDLIINDEEFWHDWPRCPQCQSRRQTICPICQVAGNDFLLAEYNPPAPRLSPTAIPLDERPLLMCPTCDEAFTPVFYKHCQWCNHEFSDGIETKIHHEEPVDAVSGRFWLAVAGLIAAFAAIVGYFWWLTR